MKQVVGRIGWVQLPGEGVLVLSRHRLRPSLGLVELPILCREIVVLLPRVIAVAAVLALPGLHPGAKPGAVAKILSGTREILQSHYMSVIIATELQHHDGLLMSKSNPKMKATDDVVKSTREDEMSGQRQPIHSEVGQLMKVLRQGGEVP